MKKSRFTYAQIMAILKQGGSGVPVSELSREHGMSSAAFFNWRSKYGGMDASMMSETKSMAEENRRLMMLLNMSRYRDETVVEAEVMELLQIGIDARDSEA